MTIDNYYIIKNKVLTYIKTNKVLLIIVTILCIVLFIINRFHNSQSKSSNVVMNKKLSYKIAPIIPQNKTIDQIKIHTELVSLLDEKILNSTQINPNLLNKGESIVSLNINIHDYSNEYLTFNPSKLILMDSQGHTYIDSIIGRQPFLTPVLLYANTDMTGYVNYIVPTSVIKNKLTLYIYTAGYEEKPYIINLSIKS